MLFQSPAAYVNGDSASPGNERELEVRCFCKGKGLSCVHQCETFQREMGSLGTDDCIMITNGGGNLMRLKGSFKSEFREHFLKHKCASRFNQL